MSKLINKSDIEKAMVNASLKQEIYDFSLNWLKEKNKQLEIALAQVTESGNNETKSTAGDKHETARAMMQIEQEKLKKQIFELELQLKDLIKLEGRTSSNKIIKGTLIQTETSIIYIAVGIGKLKFKEYDLLIISDQSPLGKALIGLKKGDQVCINQNVYKILDLE